MAHRFPARPLPGTEPSLRGLFIDRWGTLLEGPATCFEQSRAQTNFTAGAVDALFRAQLAGWQIYLIGNEDGVAHGRVTEAAWQKHELALLTHLRERGVRIQRNYACFEDPEGRAPHRRPSVFRLPDTGLLFHAAQFDGIDLSHSWVIGDGTAELAAGERAGCRVAGVRNGNALSDREFDVEPRLAASSLAGVLDVLLQSTLVAR